MLLDQKLKATVGLQVATAEVAAQLTDFPSSTFTVFIIQQTAGGLGEGRECLCVSVCVCES